MGLIKCGAWGCFDEFNRLLPDQLSEISQQIQVIEPRSRTTTPRSRCLAWAAPVGRFNAGIFVTMNPAGKGYGGRSKLPDNLKALFHAVAMSKPDNKMIAEVMMYSRPSDRHSSRSSWSRSSAISPAARRSTTIGAARAEDDPARRRAAHPGGEAARAGPRARRGGASDQGKRINTLSKLTHGDTEAFNALIGDVFPGAKVTDVAYEKLEAAVNEVLAEEKLEVLPNQVRKIMQFYEATMQRMGVVVVGPSGCGKTTMWRVLQKALNKLGQKIPTYVMNPKSMPREQ